MTDTPPADTAAPETEQKPRPRRTEHERALERFELKDAAVKKLAQRIETRRSEIRTLERELEVACKQRELHARMVKLAAEASAPERVEPERAAPEPEEPLVGWSQKEQTP